VVLADAGAGAMVRSNVCPNGAADGFGSTVVLLGGAWGSGVAASIGIGCAAAGTPGCGVDCTGGVDWTGGGGGGGAG